MTTRRLCVVLVAIVLIGLGAGDAAAQGTVSWAGGAAPGVVQRNPPIVPTAYIDVQGVVTLVNPNPDGWTRATIVFNYHLSSGGPVTGVTLARIGDDVGALNAAGTAIVPKRVQISTSGTYTIQIVCVYSRPDPNDPNKTITAAVACGGTAVVN
jgi:hypothetical protein